MTIKILASLAMAATLFSACSDSATTPPPSKADQCSAGLSNDCVLGTWSIEGPTTLHNYGEDVIPAIDESHYYGSLPATLKFYIDENQTNTFEFIHSANSKADCKTSTGKTYGTWSVMGTSLYLKTTVGNDCMDTRDAIIPVEISTAGSQVTMTFQKLFLLEPEMKQADAVQKNTATEVYTFVTAN
jgi:hypothetical protein